MSREEQFAAIYAAHRVYAARVISRIVREQDVIEDLVQETFLRVWKHLAKFRGGARIRTWIHRIAANCAKEHLRSKFVQKRFAPVLSLDDEDLVFEVGRTEAPDAGVAVKRAMRLVDRQRQTVIRLVAEGFTSQEIAGMLGKSDAAVKSMLWRARGRMRDRVWIPRVVRVAVVMRAP